MTKILVTGGAGYIGSHTCVELLQEGYDVVVVDNLRNSHEESLKRVQELTGKTLHFYQIDITDRLAFLKVFQEHDFESVIHFAGLKAVGESVENPLEYYHNNVEGTLVLCELMKVHNVTNFVFSSSATVYGDPATVPIQENFPLGATNPYGRSKLMVEEILRDLQIANPSWSLTFLRYFNPIGAHPSGRIGEDPEGVPSNLLPFIAQVALGKLSKLIIFGDDYPTPDGTGVRDYIHVVDLARGHLAALKNLRKGSGVEIYNLGTGQGFSVLEVIDAFERASGKKISYEIASRRPGDVALCYADHSKALKELKWECQWDLNKMCEDIWRWQSANPQGFC